ncbi:MAG: hypothetical protein ACFFDC_07195, partial [Promethearchaeota archaeon]
MDFSEIIFTTLGPILYNLIFISLWISWIQYHKEEEDGRIHSLFRRYLNDYKVLYPVSGLIILIFLYLLFSYAIKNTDVDDAITSGVRAFVLEGINPYQN